MECIRATADASQDADICGPTDSLPAERIWGPVPKEQAVGVGALAAASSVVLAPQQAPVWLFNSLASTAASRAVGDTDGARAY